MAIELLEASLAGHQTERFMGKTVNIKPSQLGRYEQELAGKLKKTTVSRQLKLAGDKVVSYLRSGSAQVKGATGQYSTGWMSRRRGNALVVSNKAKHMIYVEKGRKPGRMPPPSAIRRWATSKGMKADAAFPIAKSIAKRGIKARPFFTKPATQAKMRRIVNKHLKDWHGRMIQRT